MKPLFIFSSLAILFTGACKPAAPDHGNIDTNTVLKGSVPVDTAKMLVSNFTSRAYHKKNAMGFVDTRCVWFPIEQLDILIQKIKRENGDGVRFYLAAYDSVAAFHNDTLYRDHTTLVMVSTAFDSTRRKHVDYFGDKANRNRGAIITATPENQGEMCPPPATCYPEGAILFEP